MSLAGLPNASDIKIIFNSHYLALVLWHRETAWAALEAAGDVVVQAANERTRQGMLGGNFIGSDAGRGSRGLTNSVFMIRSGSKLNPTVEIGSTVDTAAFWDSPKGHYNIFLRKRAQNRFLTDAFFDNIRQSLVAAREEIWAAQRQRHREISRKITAMRSFVYAAGKFLGNVNAVINIAGFSEYRSTLMFTGRMLGDVNAIRKRNFRRRITHRAVGRYGTSTALRQISLGGYRVPRRLLRIVAGRRTSRLWSSTARDHMGRFE